MSTRAPASALLIVRVRASAPTRASLYKIIVFAFTALLVAVLYCVLLSHLPRVCLCWPLVLIELDRGMASLLEEATVVKQGWLLKRGLWSWMLDVVYLGWVDN